MVEEFRPIPGYDGVYFVSNLGRIKSKRKGETKILSGAISAGYVLIQLFKNGAHKTFRVHRLVAQAFIPNYLDKPLINHIDGNKSNNRVDNLVWCTQSENMKHAYRTGLQKPLAGKRNGMYGRSGAKSPNAKMVLNVYTGIFYDTVREAAYYEGINESTLRLKLLGSYTNNTGLIAV